MEYVSEQYLQEQRDKIDMWHRRFESTFEELMELRMKCGIIRNNAKRQEQNDFTKSIVSSIPENWEPGFKESNF